MNRTDKPRDNDKDEDDKRRYQRYENHSLTLQVSRPGIKGIIRSNPSGDCLNFSRTGLQFDCTQPLKQDEALLIDLAIDELILRDLPATVVSSRQLDATSWCHGIRFQFEKPRMKHNEVYQKLLLIEEKLKISEEFPF